MKIGYPGCLISVCASNGPNHLPALIHEARSTNHWSSMVSDPCAVSRCPPTSHNFARTRRITAANARTSGNSTVVGALRQLAIVIFASAVTFGIGSLFGTAIA
jgi:hypothetical protein